MKTLHDDERIDALQKGWHFGLSCAVVLFCAVLCGAVAGWYGVCVSFLSIRGCKGLSQPAAFLARMQFDKEKAQQARDQEMHAQQQFQQVVTQSQQDRNHSNRAQAQRELVQRLGVIDQFIRAIEEATDSSKRTLALQSCQNEITTLVAKMASGEIPADVIANPHIVNHASATSADLFRIGLGNDRINRDLIRLFGLQTGKQVEPPPVKAVRA
jgi:hypothetical protein